VQLLILQPISFQFEGFGSDVGNAPKRELKRGMVRGRGRKVYKRGVEVRVLIRGPVG